MLQRLQNTVISKKQKISKNCINFEHFYVEICRKSLLCKARVVMKYLLTLSLRGQFFSHPLAMP